MTEIKLLRPALLDSRCCDLMSAQEMSLMDDQIAGAMSREDILAAEPVQAAIPEEMLRSFQQFDGGEPGREIDLIRLEDLPP
jgi:hypothetical protein